RSSYPGAMTERWPRWHGPVVAGGDGSEASLRAVRWAAAHAAGEGTDLRLVHAIGSAEFFPGGAIAPSTELFGLLEQESNALLDQARTAALEIVPHLKITQSSTTEPAVLALIAESGAARCVVLGGSGRGALAGVLLGSTTLTLSAHAQCPVVAVRGRDRPHAPVVVGVDGSELSNLALGCAFAQAARRNVPLVAVHACHHGDSHRPRTEQGQASEPQEADERRVLDRWLDRWAGLYPQVDVEPVVVRARPRECLIERSAEASVLVVGSRGRGGFTGLLVGSTSHAMLHYAECPVMVVRPHPG